MTFARLVLPVLLLLLIIVAVFRSFEAALLSANLAMLVVVAVFVQRGFNEVIAGLQSLDRRLKGPE